MEYLQYFQYNSMVILSYFLISAGALLLNYLTGGKSNLRLFSSYRSSPLNPFTYIRLLTHVIGHTNWKHFSGNFLYILLIGPIIEEKYGSKELLCMILSTAGITGILNTLIGKNRILGASGIVFMLIVLSSFVNIEAGKIPLTFVLICLFYITDELIKSLTAHDNISHFSHIIGGICGAIFGFWKFFQ